MRHTTHHTHTTGIILGNKRRRHHRPFRDYSAQRFRCVFRATEGPHITTYRVHHRHTNTKHTTHITRIIDTMVNTKRRRHQRLFRDYSAHRVRRVFRHTHTIQDTPHTTHRPQVLGWTPGDEGTNDYSATILPHVSPCISGRQTITHHNT